MAIAQRRSKRKASSGIYQSGRSKKKYELGSAPTNTKVGEKKVNKTLRTLGGNQKTKLLVADFANIVDPKTKKFEKVKITKVVENTANRHYVRRNIITKGSIIETAKGKAKVTSRPGQDGVINAVLVE